MLMRFLNINNSSLASVRTHKVGTHAVHLSHNSEIVGWTQRQGTRSYLAFLRWKLSLLAFHEHIPIFIRNYVSSI